MKWAAVALGLADFAADDPRYYNFRAYALDLDSPAIQQATAKVHADPAATARFNNRAPFY